MAALRTVLPPFLLSRAILIVVTLVAAGARGHSALSLWTAWDARWYLGIAVHGYDWGIHGKPAVAFFPLYPLLVHAAGLVAIPAIAASLLISNLAFLGALFYVYALARPEWGSRATRHAVIILTFFPTSFFTFGPYTESLFLLCAAATLYHCRRDESVHAGVFLALALSTRSTGIALIPAAFFAAAGMPTARRFQVLLPSVACGIAYAGYLVHSGVSLDAALHAQRAWHRSLTYPWTGFTASLHWLIYHGISNLAWAAENLLGLTCVLVFLAITWNAARDVTPPVLLYCIVFWATVLLEPQWLDGYYAPFSSVDRFLLALFPLAPWVAIRVGDDKLRWIEASLAVLFLGALSMFLAGGWVG